MQVSLVRAFVALFVLCSIAGAQAPAEWDSAEKTDAFSGGSYSEFVLVGHYIQAPTKGDGSAPTITLRCKQKPEDKRTQFNGDLLSAHLSTGTVVNYSNNQAVVFLRLDDGKAQSEVWSVSTDGTALFFNVYSLGNLLWGHSLWHKENTSPPVRKVILMLDEAFAGKVVAEFDMPDPLTVSGDCGVTWYNRKK